MVHPDYTCGEIGDGPYENKIIGYGPPCDCFECRQQSRNLNDQEFLVRRYRALLSQPEAEVMVAKLVANINRDLAYLRGQCAIHGNAILSRWKHKSRAKREQILLKADPDMFPEQWTYLHDLEKYQYGDTWPRLRERHKNRLLPYMTVADLRDDPSKFIGLLLDRTRFSPQQWASYYTKRLGWGWFSPAFDVDFYFGSIIINGPRYGEITKWDKSSAEKWVTVAFPRGKFLLEAQESMLALLRKLVEQLLNGLDNGTNLGSDKWNDLSKTSFKLSGSVEYWSEFQNQPFSPPPTCDIDKLLSIAQSKLDGAGDHLWLLQTDPAYMRRTMKKIGQGHIKNCCCLLLLLFVIMKRLRCAESNVTLKAWRYSNPNPKIHNH